MKKHNFNAGPSVLPDVAIENTAKAVMELDGIGMSVLSVSHRSKEFEAILNQTIDLWKELLNIPEGYRVLFIAGGASMQFLMVPFNLMGKKSAYLETGEWAKKAHKEAKYFGEAVVVASSADKNYTYIPKGYTIPSDASYFHITTNNTIFGTEIKTDIDSPIPLVADMSSDIMSRPMDVSKYGVIYGGCQKNVGPSGLGFVIIREDLLGKVDRPIPTILNYRTHIDNNSLFNTPPTGSIYTMRETLKWFKSLGGLSKIQEMNRVKAELLYNAIDQSKMFVGTTTKEDRSLMNICFVLNEEYTAKEADFLSYAKSKGMEGIKGHRSVGGFRASCYNALPLESVKALVECMKEFEKANA